MRFWLAIAACLMLATAPAAHAAPAGEAEAAKSFAAELAKDPLWGVVWKTLERDFPEEAEGLYAFAVQRSARAATGDELALAFAQRLSRFIQENAVTMARAPDGELRAFAASSAEMYRVLRRQSAEACAAAAYGAPTTMDADMSPEELRASRDRLLVMLQGIKAGRTSPVDRAAAGKAEVDMMLAGMKALGASDALIKAANGPQGLDAASAETKCEGAILMMDALARMPGPEAGRFLSVILRRLGGDPTSFIDAAQDKFDKPVRFYLDEMQAHPEAGPSWKLLEAGFPEETMALATRFVEALRRGAAQEALDGLKVDSQGLIETNQMWVAKAPDAKLQAFAKAMAAYYHALRRDNADRCALFAMQGVTPPEPFTEPVARAAIAMDHATLDAIVAGRRAPVEWGDPTAEDRRLYVAQLKRNGVSPVLLAALSGPGLVGLSPHQQCDGTIAMLDAIAALPAESSARMIVQVFLIARTELSDANQPT
jgi:hypothetical protein